MLRLEGWGPLYKVLLRFILFLVIKAKKAIEEFVGSGQLILRLELRQGSTLEARALNFQASFEALILSLLFFHPAVV